MSEELDPDRISRLIADSLTGLLSAEGASELRRWADASLRNRQLLEELTNVESLRAVTGQIHAYDAGKAWQRVERRSRRRRLLRLAYPLAGVAAAVAIIAGVYFSGVQPMESRLVLPFSDREQIASVRLHRASGEVVVVDSTRRIDLVSAVVESDAQGMKVLPRSDSHERSPVYNMVEVPRQRIFEVTLSDGTQVTLNAGSSLRFPEYFVGKGPREVYLSGEAYFAVSKDEQRPFIVYAGEGYVRVTGTQFNVNCYEDMTSSVTTLVEGRISVGGAGLNSEFVLMPGMQVVQDQQSGAVAASNVAVAEFTAWKSGVFSFSERPLREIVEVMGRWYGCRVVFEEPAMAAMRFSGQVARSSSLDEVAEFFRRTKELNITVEAETLVIR